MLFIPVAPGTTGDGLATCGLCGRGVDPADLSDIPGNTNLCAICATDYAACDECGHEYGAGHLDDDGHCPECAALFANLPHPVPATAA